MMVNPVLFCNVCSYCAKGQINRVISPFYGTDLPGAFAEYVAIRGTNLIPIPDNVSFEDESIGRGNAVDQELKNPDGRSLVMSFLGCGAIGLLMLKVLNGDRVGVNPVDDHRSYWPKGLIKCAWPLQRKWADSE